MKTRFPITLNLDEQTRTRLGILAQDQGLSMSMIITNLVAEAWDTGPHYFAKQAAMQSFVSLALSISVARQQLGREAADEARRQASRLATTIFGAPPKKRFEVREGIEEDPRVEALFRAFEGD